MSWDEIHEKRRDKKMGSVLENQPGWDYIVENCTPEFVAAIERDFEDFSSLDLEIVSIVGSVEGVESTVVYLKSFSFYLIHTEYYPYEDEPEGDSEIFREQIDKSDLRYLKEKLGEII